MMSMLVETLPVLFDPEIYKLGKLRQALKDGVFDRVENPLLIMQEAYDLKDDEQLKFLSHQEEVEPQYSGNIEALYELIQIIKNEMAFISQPNFTGKIRHDNMVQKRIDKYYDSGIKMFARQIRIYIDSLIQVDHFPAKKMGDYRRLESLILKTDGIQSEEYLLKLLCIARQTIPPNLITLNSYVIDSNAVDPTRVSEG